MHEQPLFDLNKIPTENNFFDVSENEIVFNKDYSCLENNLNEPFVGQYFLSEEEAFVFFRNYARNNGFSIRKGRFNNNKNGEKGRRDFFCHRQGKPDEKEVDCSKQQRNRGSSRCECKVYMRITLKRENEIFPKEWQVTILNLEHNHDLLSSEEVRFLPAYRCITTEDEKRILMLREGGLSIRLIMRVMELEKNVSRGHLPFLSKDVRNFFSKLYDQDAHNDVKELLEYCKKSKIENSNFQFTFTTDNENKLDHIFWSLAQCFDLYQKYGDVVVFDTTYKVNSYDMPFGIFVGIDNNGRTILYGCALLRNEKTNTFRWLMKNFVLLMRKAPISILTDQDLWMTEAIAKEMPFTKHAFCIWHITAKFSGWFISILKSDYSSWCSEFYNLYRLDTIEEFEQQWPSVIAKYNLKENKHVSGLYNIKTFWVPAYLRRFFFGGMTTTERSESINAFVKRFISSKTHLDQFIRQIDLAIEDIGQTQVHDTMLQKYRGSNLRSQSSLEEQGYAFYTPFAFKKFQEEFGRAIQYIVEEKTCTCFIVTYHKSIRFIKHTVIWDGMVAKCSCKYFEFVGILCRHILSVFIHKDCFEIPHAYWLSRWSRKQSYISHEASIGKTTRMNNFELDTDTIDLVGRPPRSKTKGCPKKRMKGGVELAKKANLQRAKKKKKIMSENKDVNPILSFKY